MIRFPCDQCQQILKAPGDRVGAKATCPRCGHHTRVPATSSAPADHVAKENRLSEQLQETLRETFPPMTGRVKGVIGALTGVVGLSLAGIFIFHEGLSTLSGVLFCISLIALLICLYGVGLSCPACRLWWAKEERNKELYARTIFYKDAAGKIVGSEHGDDQPFTGEGTPFVRSVYRTYFVCRHCSHRWHRSFKEEYQHTGAHAKK